MDSKLKDGGKQPPASPVLPTGSSRDGEAVPNWQTKRNCTVNEKKICQKGLQEDWPDQVRVGLKDDKIKKDVVTMLKGFSDMWTGRVGKIDIFKHCIDLVPRTRSIYEQPYRAGPKAKNSRRTRLIKCCPPE